MSKIKSEIWTERSPANYLQVKYDGNFTRIKKNEFGEVSVFSSLDTNLTEQIINCAPKWFNNLQKNLPLSSCILGELYYYSRETGKGLPASYIKSGLSIGENYVDVESNNIDGRLKRIMPLVISNNQLIFACFAIESGWENINRFSPLETIESEVLKLGVKFPAYIKVNCPTCECFFEKYNRDRLLNYWLPLFRERKDVCGNIEGFMLKDGNLVGWKKVKEDNTIDVFVSGYESGKGKYRGKIGSLLGSVYNGIGKEINICKVSGFSDEIRDWITDAFFGKNGLAVTDIIGSVIEVQYQLIGSLGRLRHPVFKSFREDKLKNECTTEQCEELSNYWG